MKQAEIIASMTNEQLRVQVYLTQGLVLIVCGVLGYFIFDSLSDFTELFEWNISEILLFGIGPGFLVVAVDIGMYRFIPREYWDDGGINEKIFTGSNIYQILFLTVIVAISEELLFRGLLQPIIGYVATSLIFSLIHVRYLSKPLLFISVMVLSFTIGFLFEITNNLLVTIAMHFIIDFCLALYIRFLGGTGNEEQL